MKTESLLIIVALCLLGSGCRLAHNAWLTTIAEPIHYPRNLDDKLSHKRFTGMAEVAFDEAVASARADLDNYTCDPYSIDHRRGFVDGFVDFLDAGGVGAPPPLPPRKYWRGKFQSPYGSQCIQDWFEGYEHGVAIARASNYRSFIVVPTSDAIVMETQQASYGRLSTVDEQDEGDLDTEPNRVAAVPNHPRRLDTPAKVSRLPRDTQVE